MAERDRPEINCDNCTGACCSDVSLALRPAEAEWFRAAGTKLNDVLLPLPSVSIASYEDGQVGLDLHEFNWADHVEAFLHYGEEATDPRTKEYWRRVISHISTMRPGQGLYIMEGACGNLKNGRCADYDNRVEICREFPEGSTACKIIRQREQVATPVTVYRRKPASN